jgi:erythrin-vacuolar iron transport family protein
MRGIRTIGAESIIQTKVGAPRGTRSQSLLASIVRGVCRYSLDAAHDCDEMSKTFGELEEREILALAIALEEEDSRIYRDFAEKLKAKHSAIASILEAMSAEESAHRARLLETYKLEYGDHIPFVRRQDVKGFVKRRPVWLNRVLQPQQVLAAVMAMEAETRRFYREVSNTVASASIRGLLGELADAEEDHQDTLVELAKEHKESVRPEV